MNFDEALTALRAGKRVKDKDGSTWVIAPDPDGQKHYFWKNRGDWNTGEPYRHYEPFSIADEPFSTPAPETRLVETFKAMIELLQSFDRKDQLSIINASMIILGH